MPVSKTLSGYASCIQFHYLRTESHLVAPRRGINDLPAQIISARVAVSLRRETLGAPTLNKYSLEILP